MAQTESTYVRIPSHVKRWLILKADESDMTCSRLISKILTELYTEAQEHHSTR